MGKFLDINQKEVDALISRIETAIESGKDVSSGDLKVLLETFKAYLHLQERLKNNDLTIFRLKKLLGIISSSEKKRDLAPTEETHNSLEEKGFSKEEESSATEKPTKKQTPHGKRSAEDFEEAKVVRHSHTLLKSGDCCPECNGGKLYKYEPSQFVRISGQAPLQATIHIIDQLRCNNCQKIFKAPIPEDITNDGPTANRFGFSAIAMIVLLKYAAGTPFFRQHVLQKMLKIPIMPSTLWDQCEACANAAKPIFDLLKKIAATGYLFYTDDTSNKILNIKPIYKKKRHSEKERLRTGVHTSGLISILDDNREIILYKTGINHAGEFLDEILLHRPEDSDKFLHMSDGLSSNKPTVLTGINIECNAHNRRQFVDLIAHYPEEIQFVIDIYEEVYKNDAETKKLNFTPKERLAHHKELSLPFMKKLFTWAEEKVNGHFVEPNSPFGKALEYMLKRKEGLLAFTEYLGAPLDNNKMEQKLKFIILHRKNSLFFKEQIGAVVADILTSLCATAAEAEINVYDYLIEIQRNAADVRINPDKYLPWNFRSVH